MGQINWIAPQTTAMANGPQRTCPMFKSKEQLEEDEEARRWPHVVHRTTRIRSQQQGEQVLPEAYAPKNGIVDLHHDSPALLLRRLSVILCHTSEANDRHEAEAKVAMRLSLEG